MACLHKMLDDFVQVAVLDAQLVQPAHDFALFQDIPLNLPMSATTRIIGPLQSGASAIMAKPPTQRYDIERFLAKAQAAPPPAQRQDAPSARILFALDATASREPTWDLATNLHAELFQAARDAKPDAVAVQLVYYRGFREFHASPWSVSPAALLTEMTGVGCRGGLTQIERVLTHALDEAKRQRVDAVVLVGDACEEPPDALAGAAGKLAVLNLPCFVFQEGHDPMAARAFRNIADITGGAYAPFAQGSADQLRALFSAVAHYATEGRAGIAAIRHDIVRGLLDQLPP